jgi:hypothetical protein
MSLKSSVLSAGAVALSSSSILASLVAFMRRRGDLTADEVREIYEDALLGLEEGQMDDDSGVFAAARELIEMHLRP